MSGLQAATGPSASTEFSIGSRWLALPDPEAQPVTANAVDYPTAVNASASRKKKIIIASVTAALVLMALGAGLVWKDSHDTDIRNATNAAIASSSESSKAAAAKAASDAEAERVQRDLAAKRAARAASVKEIADSVKTMAEKHVRDGLYDGPILSVTCDPVGGGSTDDLNAKATVFECFVAGKDNGDGTLSGRYYHATMNWDTGSFTYGIGQPK